MTLHSHRLTDRDSPIADDDDEVRFCSACAFSAASMRAGYDKAALRDLHVLVEHVGPFRAGEHVFRAHDPFRAIFAVRGGTVKTVSVDADGNEQVLGFYIPGEVVGLNAIYPARYPCDAIALESSYFCRFSFPAISALATRMPGLQQQLFKLISKELGMATRLAGDYGAEERMAAFLIDLAERYATQGFPARRLHLAMSRNEIAAHLRLAPETVSRILGRFRETGLIALDVREVELRAPDQLNALARNVLGR